MKRMAPAKSGDDFLRPIVTVDLAIFALIDGALGVLLVRRAEPPYAGRWALPGGFIHVDEDRSLDDAARRVLAQKAGVTAPYLEQLGAFGGPDRDPRGWSVTLAYFALVDAATLNLPDKAPGLRWQAVSGGAMTASLAFDHGEIVTQAAARLRNKVEYTTLPVHLLPAEFTLTELQRVYEQLLGRTMDKSAFRKRIASVDFIEPIAGAMRHGSNRPAQLYRVRQGQAAIFFDRTI